MKAKEFTSTTQVKAYHMQHAAMEAMLTNEKYMALRDRMIGIIENEAAYLYKKDRELFNGIIDLTICLKTAEISKEFVLNMWGFIQWAITKGENRSAVLTTIIHDLGEFSRHRNEKWFCPRTSGYSQFLVSAGGVIHINNIAG